MRALLLLTLGLALLPAASAQAVGAPEAIANLNAQREANGIPGGITENADWSQGCALHLDYLVRNPDAWDTNPHDEESGRDGYTDAGRDAARSSVLGSGGPGFTEADGNPWESAPIHLMQLLAPDLSVTGYADGSGVCMSTFRGYGRPAPDPPVVYTYPGDGSSVYPHETAFESPFTPGEFVGIPAGAATGPYLYVLPHGNGVEGRLTAASLTGPDGPVEVRTVDDKTSDAEHGDLGGYLPAGGMVIPVKPLKPASSYSASITFTTDGGAVLDRSWSFNTTGDATPPDGGSGDGSGDGGSGSGTDTSAKACKRARADLKSARAALKKAKARYKRHRTAARRRAVKRARGRVQTATRRMHARCG